MASYADILKKKAKDWNCPDMMSRAKKNIDRIPFSSPFPNYATYGGIPRRRVTVFYGDPGGGKSSTSIDICCNAVKLFKREFEQEVARLRELVGSGKKEYAGPLEDLLERGPKRVLYVDLENAFDWKWAANMGLAEGDIDIMQPDNITGEELLQTLLDIMETGEVGLIVIDSIPSIVPKSVIEKKIGEKTVAALAGILTTFLYKAVSYLTRYDCTLLMINQTRPNMENPYVVNMPGGDALKFYASVILFFRKGNPVDFVGNELPKNTEDPAGYMITIKQEKQKTAPNDRKLSSYFLMAKTGIRPDFDYAKLAIDKYGIIKKAGGWFAFCDPSTGEVLVDEDGKPVKINGVVRVYDYLQTHSDYYEQLKAFIEADINGQEDSAVESSLEEVL